MDYFTGGDRPYLITGSDDHTAKVSSTCCLYINIFGIYLYEKGKVIKAYHLCRCGITKQKAVSRH